MPGSVPFRPGGSQGLDISQLLQLAAALKAGAASPASAGADPANEPAKFIRELVRASFSDDARGAELRAAWKQIGAGALELIRAFTAGAAAAVEE